MINTQIKDHNEPILMLDSLAKANNPHVKKLKDGYFIGYKYQQPPKEDIPLRNSENRKLDNETLKMKTVYQLTQMPRARKTGKKEDIIKSILDNKYSDNNSIKQVYE